MTPSTAQRISPAVGFELPVDLGTHQEAVMHFTCKRAVLTVTLYPLEGRGRTWQ